MQILTSTWARVTGPFYLVCIKQCLYFFSFFSVRKLEEQKHWHLIAVSESEREGECMDWYIKTQGK